MKLRLPLPIESIPIVAFSEFVGIGYFGDDYQYIITPIFSSRGMAEKYWNQVMRNDSTGATVMDVAFIEHPSKYEFLAYPVDLIKERINYVLYRSFSSLNNLQKLKNKTAVKTFIKFGWHDMTKKNQFDVPAAYANVNSVEFKSIENINDSVTINSIRGKIKNVQK